MSSVASCATTVSFRGEEVDMSECIDQLFIDIQNNLNNCQCVIRELAMSEEHSDTFLEAMGFHHQIEDFVDVLTGLFAELKGVSRDCVGKCPKEYKEEYKAIIDKRKEEKTRKKMI